MQSTLRDKNRGFYDALWSSVRLIEGERFNTWPLIAELSVAAAGPRLEVAPGLRPRLGLAGTYFVDQSAPALRKIAKRGGRVAHGSITALPFAGASFGLVAAFDIVEHVEEDVAALTELARVLDRTGVLLLAVPLHPERWTAFDDMVGHYRRYRPGELVDKLAACDLAIEQSAVFGMQPQPGRWLDLGMWYLEHHRQRALWWYDRVFLPLAVRFQPKLDLQPGLIAADQVDEVLLVCRRR